MQKACLSILFGWLSFFLFVFPAAGQQSQPISGSFSDLPFEQFVQRIEAGTDYNFYYNPPDLNRFTVTATITNGSLHDLLQQVFRNTVFHFAIDSMNRVFITKHYAIQTTLPEDFFQHKKPTADSIREPNITIPEEPVGKKRQQSSAEQKLFSIGTKTDKKNKGNATLTGYIRNSKNGEPVIGAAVFIDTPALGAVTDQYGYYTLILPTGRHLLNISGIGMKEARRQIMVYSDGKLDVELEDDIPSLKTVVVVSEKHSNVKGTQMGLDRLSIKTIRQIPVVFGETDVLRVVLSLPGVTSVGEASTGFNVRGGSADQNLILFNDATIYNPAHLFGFFSAFNADVVKGVELYKSTIPEKFGGRLSSVLDVTARDGNTKKLAGSGGIGPLTGKLILEGPIVKEKTSFLLGGRTTYSNWILKRVPNDDYKNSKASFYDLDLHISHTLNARNNLYLTAYRSYDRFNLKNDTAYQYSNSNVNLKWKHIFNNKFYGVLVGGMDRYEYAVTSHKNPVNAYRLDFDIRQTHFRSDFNYTPNNRHALNFGLNTIYYQLKPGSLIPAHRQSLVAADVLSREQALETAVYFGDRYTISPELSVNAGLRYSVFQYLGPRQAYQYVPGLPRTKNTIQDTLQYGSGKVIQTYHAPEVRIGLRYSLSGSSSVKVSFNTLQQYIHMLSNTTIISPTDIWKLSDPVIKPQKGYQISAGFYKNLSSNTVEASLEFYYKRMKNYLDYKSGARLIMNHHIETDVISTRGKAYGGELMIKKTSGKINGWISYTYSRTWLKADDPLAGETINGGRYYPANFDKPHNANLIGNYRFSHRLSASLTVVYNTGRPITLPIAVFNQGGAQRLYYSDRNQYRIPDYFRTDLSVNLEGNHKLKKLTHNSWSFGVYNLTGRQNAYSVYFVQENGTIRGYKLSIFGTLIPFLTYNFKF